MKYFFLIYVVYTHAFSLDNNCVVKHEIMKENPSEIIPSKFNISSNKVSKNGLNVITNNVRDKKDLKKSTNSTYHQYENIKKVKFQNILQYSELDEFQTVDGFLLTYRDLHLIIGKPNYFIELSTFSEITNMPVISKDYKALIAKFLRFFYSILEIFISIRDRFLEQIRTSDVTNPQNKTEKYKANIIRLYNDWFTEEDENINLEIWEFTQNKIGKALKYSFFIKLVNLFDILEKEGITQFNKHGFVLDSFSVLEFNFKIINDLSEFYSTLNYDRITEKLEGVI